MSLAPSTIQEIEEALRRYPERRTAVLDALRAAQGEKGYLSSESVHEVATLLGLDPNALFSLVTFYDLYHDHPVGQHILMVCRGISCYLRGSDEILRYLSQKLGIGVEETTLDGRFTLRQMECLALCSWAPAMIVSSRAPEGAVAIDEGTFPPRAMGGIVVTERYFENLTEAKLDSILTELSELPPLPIETNVRQ